VLRLGSCCDWFGWHTNSSYQCDGLPGWHQLRLRSFSNENETTQYQLRLPMYCFRNNFARASSTTKLDPISRQYHNPTSIGCNNSLSIEFQRKRLNTVRTENVHWPCIVWVSGKHHIHRSTRGTRYKCSESSSHDFNLLTCRFNLETYTHIIYAAYEPHAFEYIKKNPRHSDPFG